MISVIIPTYNREKTILRSINSVLNQTLTDLELIIADDCSTDNTAQLIAGINDKRIRYLCLDRNQGACVARNAGIDVAEGEYIAFQDSDDTWAPDKLEKTVNALQQTGAEVCFHKMRKHYLNSEKTDLFPHIKESKFVTHKDFCSTNSQISTQTIIGKREVFYEHRFDPAVRCAQDYDWSIRSSRNHTFYYLDYVLADQYLQSDSISMQKAEVNLKTKIYLLNKYEDEIKNNPLFEIALLRSIAGSKLRLGENAVEEYKRINYLDKTKMNYLRYLMSRIGALPIVYKLLGIHDIY